MEVCVYHALDSINEINRKMPEMTLRDLFAMNAMNAIIGNHTYDNLDDIFNETVHRKAIPTEESERYKESEEKLSTREWIARASYMMADAMVQARKKKS